MKYRNNYVTSIGVEGIHVLNTGDWRVKRPVILQEACVRCGSCFLYCPVNAVYKTEDGKFDICYDYCKGCGICAHECKKNAITMVAEEAKI